MEEFFTLLPYNTSKIYSMNYIQNSKCKVYVPAETHEEAEFNRNNLDIYFNGNQPDLLA